MRSAGPATNDRDNCLDRDLLWPGRACECAGTAAAGSQAARLGGGGDLRQRLGAELACDAARQHEAEEPGAKRAGEDHLAPRIATAPSSV